MSGTCHQGDILRIYICGPHSTGKTTLLNDLRPRLGEVTVAQEVARGIIREHGWKREDFLPSRHPEVFFQMNKEILEKQISLEAEFTEAGKDFICDRAIDPLVYAKLYIGEEARQALYRLPNLQTWLKRMRGSLVLLLSPHEECILDDHVRLPPELGELKTFHVAMETELKLNAIPYHKITMLDRRERMETVLKALDDFRRLNHFTRETDGSEL